MHHRPDLVRRRLSIAAINLLAITIAGGQARAQSAEAAALFDQGDKLMSAGKFAEACEAFEASNKIESRAGTLIRLGECDEKNAKLASAWSAYKDALTRVKDPNKKAIASAKVAELEPKLSYLTISVPPTSRVDGLTITRNDKPIDPVLWNRPLPLDGGDYVISVRSPGNDEWKTSVSVPVAGGKLTVDVPKLAKHAKPANPEPTVTGPSPTPATDEGTPNEDTRAPRFTPRRKLAIGVAAVSALSVAAGIVLGTQANSKKTDAFALCPDPMMACAGADRANALIDSGRSRALEANIAFVVAGAAAIGAGVLWFTGAREAHHVAIAPTIAPQQTGVVLIGQF